MAVVGDHASKGFVLGLVLIGVTLYGLGLVIHRLFFSPLSKIPGPWLTRISTIPEANALKENRRAQWITDLFAQNPDAIAIRTSPNSVSFNHPDAVKEIYGHGKTTDGFGKSSWYDAFSTTGESLFSTRSKKRHAMKRRMVAHGFSAQSLQTFEPYVDEMLHKFMSRIDAFANSGEPFDIYFWFELFTMDVSTYTNGQKGNSIHVVATWSFTWIEFTLGELALGKHFGALDDGKPVRYSTLVEQSQRFANHSGLLPFGQYNVRVLSWIPIPSIQKLYRSRLEYLEYAREALERRFHDNRQQSLSSGKARQDIMQRFIEAQDPETGHRMDFNELRAETSSLMVAGASTGSVTMNWMIYYLCKHPAIMFQIVEELKTLFRDDPNGERPLAYTRLNKVSLLEHAETECLRLHPPIGYAMPRDTPPQGAVICGVYVPGGVAVGVPAASIGRNADVYPNPHKWDPERWLGKKGDLPTMKTSYLGFGHGSRQCIGRNVANQFVLKMIAQLLLRYEIELESPDLILGTKEFTIQKPDQKYRVILRPRQG